MPGYLQSVDISPREGWNASAYPFNLPVLRGLRSLKLHPRCTFLVGENGSGKSTLAEAIAVKLGYNAEGGSKDHLFATRETHSPLHEHIRLMRDLSYVHDGWFLRAESLYTTASYLDDTGSWKRNSGGRALHAQSHGEAMFSLMQHRFEGDGIYILDEPEAGLSPTRQLSLLTRLHDLCRARSQFVIATHSPILLAYPDALIYRCGEEGLSQVAYEDCEPVKVTRSFLNRRERFIEDLLAPEPDEPEPR